MRRCWESASAATRIEGKGMPCSAPWPRRGNAAKEPHPVTSNGFQAPAEMWASRNHIDGKKWDAVWRLQRPFEETKFRGECWAWMQQAHNRTCEQIQNLIRYIFNIRIENAERRVARRNWKRIEWTKRNEKLTSRQPKILHSQLEQSRSKPDPTWEIYFDSK